MALTSPCFESEVLTQPGCFSGRADCVSVCNRASWAARHLYASFAYRVRLIRSTEQLHYMDPSTLPASLSIEAQRVAQRTGLSLPETIQESHRLGLAIYRERLNRDSRTNPKVFNVFQISFATGLSIEKVGRHCMELGLPILLEQLWVEPVAGLQPLSEEESRRCFEAPHPEFDALAAHCASLVVPTPEDESLGHF